MSSFSELLYAGDLSGASAAVPWVGIGNKPALYIEHGGAGTLVVTAKISPIDGEGAPEPTEDSAAIAGSTPTQWVPDIFDGPFRKLYLTVTATGVCSGIKIYLAQTRPE